MAIQKIKRLLEHRIVHSLNNFPAVYLAGPRQSGKTTLAERIAATTHPADYVTFDNLQLRSAAQNDPEAFLRGFKGPVVLDEIQMVPEIFRPLKIIIDENRHRSDGGCGQFLLTGSASVMALPRLSDALVGRMALHTLLPFSACEVVENTDADFIEKAFSKEWFFEKRTPKDLTKMLFNASFPELLSLHDATAQTRYEWCNGYLNTVLQRDVRSLLEVDKLTMLPDLLHLLGSRTGGVLNEASLSRILELNQLTVKKYRLLLENLFLTLSIPAWSTNLGKRLVKSPKVYLNDLNILAYLLNVEISELKQKNPILFGQLLENFVAIELNKQITFSNKRVRLYHYRTNTGQEIDFLLEGSEGVVAIEVKANSSVSPKDFRHIESLQKDLGDRFHRGFVIYQGSDIVPFGERLFSLPLDALWA